MLSCSLYQYFKFLHFDFMHDIVHISYPKSINFIFMAILYYWYAEIVCHDSDVILVKLNVHVLELYSFLVTLLIN